MFYHKNLAVDGLYPGLATHVSIANLGTFQVEIIIEPVVRGGGGGGWVPGAKLDKYKITIRVTSKGKVWNYSRVVNNVTARVIARLTGVKFKPEPEILVNSVTVNKPATDIKVYKK